MPCCQSLSDPQVGEAAGSIRSSGRSGRGLLLMMIVMGLGGQRMVNRRLGRRKLRRRRSTTAGVSSR